MSDTRNHTLRDQLAAALYGLTWTSEFTDAEDELQESYRDRADELLASDAIAAVRAAAVAETTAAIAANLLRLRIVCPVHGIPDCGPLLNGCSIPRHIAEWRGEVYSALTSTNTGADQ